MWLGLAVLVLVMASANSGGIASSLNTMHVGPTSASLTSWSDAGTTISNLAGPVNVDLSQLQGGTGTRVLRIRDVFGPIRVVLPAGTPGYTIHVRAHTAFGPVAVPGVAERSGGVFTTRTFDQINGGGVLDIDATGAFGPVTVITAQR